MAPISMMIKPASSGCNMKCEYCFYKDVAQNRQEYYFDEMSESTAEKIIREAFIYADGDMVSFAFQGGEPMLRGLDFFKFFTAEVECFNDKKSPIFYSIQTNGSLIDAAWAQFFHDNSFLVGLSLDGDSEGNKFRKKADGNSSFYKTLSAANILKIYKVEFNILTVLTGYCADNCERIYKFFRDKGFKYIQFIPCLRPFGSDEKNEMYMTSQQYTSFLIKTFNMYVKDYIRGNYVSIRQFDNWVRLFFHQQTEQCGINGFCQSGFVIESNGNTYPCDFYCVDEYLLGNINECSFSQLAKSENSVRFIKESLTVDEKCKRCKFFQICRGGGCKRTKESADYCESYYKFFSSCLPLFRVFSNEKQ